MAVVTVVVDICLVFVGDTVVVAVNVVAVAVAVAEVVVVLLFLCRLLEAVVVVVSVAITVIVPTSYHTFSQFQCDRLILRCPSLKRSDTVVDVAVAATLATTVLHTCPFV